MWLLTSAAIIRHQTALSECDPEWSRLGDSCLKVHPNTGLDAQEAADACAEMESTIWWPETLMEVQFVASHLW